MDIFKVAIVGGGAMGRGIAILVASKGIPVVVKEVNDELVDNALAEINSWLTSRYQRGKISLQQMWNIRALISATSKYEGFVADADLVIEAIPENMGLKKKIFGELDKIVKPEAIFASNTSSLSISEMAAVTSRQAKVAGLHFFNPPQQMMLVELISAAQTGKDTIETLRQFTADLGKTVITVRECPGFLVNRLLMPYLNEAALLLSETNLTSEQIDDAAREFGWPMGPFTLLDNVVGIDVAAEVADVLYRGYGERAKPAPLMRALVDLKRFGKKSPDKAGFYGGDTPLSEIIDSRFGKNRMPLSPADGFERMMMGLVNEAFLCLEDKIASPEDVEIGCLYGIGFPMALGGPIHWAQSIGLEKVFENLCRLEETYGSRFHSSNLLTVYIINKEPIIKVDEW